MELEEIQKLSEFEFYEIMFNKISELFIKQFPEYFIRWKTTDKKIYETANKSGYSYYMKIMNAGIDCFDNSYKIRDRFVCHGINIFKERLRLLQSLENCVDIRIWCFDNVEIK